MNTAVIGRTPARASESTSSYSAALAQAMEDLARDSRVLFIGQGVLAPGTFMSRTLAGVPEDRRIEFPVAEEMQLGVSIGMALAGRVPVSVYPRWNFLLLAANQMVNHLDKMRPHVIVRVGIGSTKPLDPGPQHKGDFTAAFQSMMPNTYFARVNNATDVAAEYRQALERTGPSVLVEHADLYAG